MEQNVFSVGLYLDLVNEIVSSTSARIQGEVGQCTKRGNAIYFSIRDPKDKAVLNCFMWLSNYNLSGVEIAEGMEIIVTGYSEIYKPTGRLALRTSSIELVGEGELKKAYDKLKSKLDAEGFFDPSHKKSMQPFPRRIGLITSKEGAVIHDFLNNLDRRGYDISHYDSRVEGVKCVPDLIAGLRHFKKMDLDALVVIRGGGSLESFIPFNNEAVIREMRTLPFPIVAGLGHDRDIPLFSLAADVMTSTPTAVTSILNASWKEAEYQIDLFEHRLLSGLRNITSDIKQGLDRSREAMRTGLASIITEVHTFLDLAENTLRHADPHRQLKLGYSIARSGGKIIRSITDIKKGNIVTTEVSDGSFDSRVL